MLALWQDVRYGLRMLAKNPGFTAVAVITLALGIGASTAIFSVVNTVVLRPLPYQDADRLVTVWGYNRTRGLNQVSPPDFVDWRSQNHVFESMAASTEAEYTLTGVGEPSLIIACANVANLLLARAAGRQKEVAVLRLVIGQGLGLVVAGVIIGSMKGDVKRKHFPADGGSWISLASRPCEMESCRSGRRLELDIHAVPLMPTEPGRMQAAGLGLPTMVLSETRGLWLCGVVRGWPRVSPRPARELARGV